jgi:hypothetical protein
MDCKYLGARSVLPRRPTRTSFYFWEVCYDLACQDVTLLPTTLHMFRLVVEGQSCHRWDGVIQSHRFVRQRPQIVLVARPLCYCLRVSPWQVSSRSHLHIHGRSSLVETNAHEEAQIQGVCVTAEQSSRTAGYYRRLVSQSGARRWRESTCL